MLINDIVARPKECEALVKAYEAGTTCVANNFRCKIPHVKAFFAVLTDGKNAGLFSAEERDVIREHVPWTRVVEDVRSDYYGEPIELLDYIRKKQETLVLKPSDEYGGTGVTLGWKVNAKEWERRIAGGFAGRREIQGAWMLDCAGEDSVAAGTVPYDCWRRESRDAGHAQWISHRICSAGSWRDS